MEYSIQKLAAMSGVTTRTLRYYDEIGLLKPVRVSSSGYRIYGSAQVDLLQQILFYRELDFPLEEIRRILADPAYDKRRAMEGHLRDLLLRRERLTLLIHTLIKTMESEDGEKMKDAEKFAGFKEKLVLENEEQYGEELRCKYGRKAVEASNAKIMGWTQEQYQEYKDLEMQIQSRLEEAVLKGEDPAGETGKALAALHKDWLCFTWPSYQKQAHRGVAEMYVADERFRAYYDKRVTGCAEFLRSAIIAWLEEL